MGKHGAVDELKAAGLKVGRRDQGTAHISEIFMPRGDHPIAHPRADMPVSPAIKAHIKTWGVQHALVVRRRPMRTPGGAVDVLELIAGSRRSNAVNEAMADGDLPTKFEMVPIRLFEGSDAECLVERAKENNDEAVNKVPDDIHVLATMARQMDRVGVDHEAIRQAIGTARVKDLQTLRALLRWPDLTPTVQERFNLGASLALLDGVLKVPQDEQWATLDLLEASGAKSPRRAARVLSEAGVTKAKTPSTAQVAKWVAKLEKAAENKADEMIILGMKVARGQVQVSALPEHLRDAIREQAK